MSSAFVMYIFLKVFSIRCAAYISDMYYGGDSSSTLHTLSYTCSYCGQMGFSIALLLEHIRSSHGGNSGASATEVVCQKLN